MATGLFNMVLLGALAGGQPAGDLNCRDDRGVDRCAAEQQVKMRSAYGVSSIEEHARRGDQVRRIFYVDGYGRDLALISFIRSPGRDIELEVRTPGSHGKAATPLRAAVPQAVWQGVVERSRHFDRKLAPAAGSDGSGNRPVSICLHSWVYTAEASDQVPQGSEAPAVRKAVEDACQSGLVQDLANALAQEALSLLPPCAALDPKQHRNAASQLAACTSLSGDRIAAAQVMNSLREMRYERGELTREVRAAFGHRTTFEWGGQAEQKDWQAAAPFWLERLKTANASFYPTAFHGERSDRVRVQGYLARQAAGNGAVEQAPAEMIWAWEPSQRFAIQQVKVGAFTTSR